MYGQLYYGNLAVMLNFKGDKQARKEARRTVARLSMMLVAFAGVGGLPAVELARALDQLRAGADVRLGRLGGRRDRH